MKKFKVSFTGRKSGAIGITYKISETIEASNNAKKEDLLLKLYNTYEHISNLKIL